MTDVKTVRVSTAEALHVAMDDLTVDVIEMEPGTYTMDWPPVDLDRRTRPLTVNGNGSIIIDSRPAEMLQVYHPPCATCGKYGCEVVHGD